MTIADGLKLMLANTYALAASTHLAHWNVRGKQFPELHKLFQKQYEELYEAADDIAEKIRSLKMLPPGGVEAFASIKTIKDVPQQATADAYVAALLTCHETLIADGIALRKLCGKEDDLETQDFVMGQTQARQKNAWMLRSYLG